MKYCNQLVLLCIAAAGCEGSKYFYFVLGSSFTAGLKVCILSKKKKCLPLPSQKKVPLRLAGKLLFLYLFTLPSNICPGLSFHPFVSSWGLEWLCQGGRPRHGGWKVKDGSLGRWASTPFQTLKSPLWRNMGKLWLPTVNGEAFTFWVGGHSSKENELMCRKCKESVTKGAASWLEWSAECCTRMVFWFNMFEVGFFT